jgi:polysaccharide export outer membrane protein
MINIKRYVLLACVGLLFTALGTSCGIRKKVVYFQPAEDGTDTIATYSYSPVYHSNDLLSITVSAMDAEAVKPFNTSVISFTSEDGRASTVPMQQGYFVDAEGWIDFPVLGRIKVGGLKRSEAVLQIKQKLAPYVVDPSVVIKILNYKVTVLGDVKLPGSFPITSERVTLPEALGMAGDMNMTGVRKNVLVIRDIDGVKTEIRVDLTSKSAYNSPGYYLQQNDVVYVEPNKAKRNSSIIGTNAGIFISVASLLLTSIALLTR